MGQQCASYDAGWRNLIGQWPVSNSLEKKLNQLIYNRGGLLMRKNTNSKRFILTKIQTRSLNYIPLHMGQQ